MIVLTLPCCGGTATAADTEGPKTWTYHHADDCELAANVDLSAPPQWCKGHDCPCDECGGPHSQAW